MYKSVADASATRPLGRHASFSEDEEHQGSVSSHDAAKSKEPLAGTKNNTGIQGTNAHGLTAARSCSADGESSEPETTTARSFKLGNITSPKETSFVSTTRGGDVGLTVGSNAATENSTSEFQPDHQPSTRDQTSTATSPITATDRLSTTTTHTLSIIPASSPSYSSILSTIFHGVLHHFFIPFVNGIMLGFGEIAANELAFRYGWFGSRVVLKDGGSASVGIIRHENRVSRGTTKSTGRESVLGKGGVPVEKLT